MTLLKKYGTMINDDEKNIMRMPIFLFILPSRDSGLLSRTCAGNEAQYRAGNSV